MIEIADDGDALVLVAEPPLPLEAGDLDAQIGVVAQLRDPVLREDGDAEDDDDDEQRDGGVEDLERDVGMRLLR